MADLHKSTEELIKYAYQRLRPKHLDVEDYCTTVMFRLGASRACLQAVRVTLEHSAVLGENETQMRLVKESEAAIFHAGSALEAFGQLLNLCMQLGLSEATKPGQQGVSFGAAKRLVISSFPNTQITKALSSDHMGAFIEELKAVRDQITHRRLLDYRARILGNGIWMPSIIVERSEKPMVPFLERLVALAETQVQKCAAALVVSLP